MSDDHHANHESLHAKAKGASSGQDADHAVSQGHDHDDERIAQRRRVLKAALLATPVMLSLSARSVRAADGISNGSTTLGAGESQADSGGVQSRRNPWPWEPGYKPSR